MIEELVARRHDGAAHDAVPRRGRPPRRPHHGDRLRSDHRRGHRRPSSRQHYGATVVEITFATRRRRSAPEPLLAAARQDGTIDAATLGVTIADAGRGTLEVVRTLDREPSIPIRLTVREPSLDDVFLSLTGHRAEEAATNETDATTTNEVRHDRDHASSTGTDVARRAARRSAHRVTPRSPSPTASSIAWRNLALDAAHARGVGVQQHPADHLRADVPLRVRRRDHACPASRT